MDHATRLELYRRAGVDIGSATVIGPELRMEYQRIAAERMGVRGYFPVNRRARLYVSHLWISSNCHNLRHPAHWAGRVGDRRGARTLRSGAAHPGAASADLAPRHVVSSSEQRGADRQHCWSRSASK